MMTYVQGSDLWNPFDYENIVKEWTAKLYLIRKEKGITVKDCSTSSHNSRMIEYLAKSFRNTPEDEYDETVEVWDITMEQLQKAYKTVAMERQIPWSTDYTYEETPFKCVPAFKREVKIKDFQRRNTWLYVEEGSCKRLVIFFLLYRFIYTCFLFFDVLIAVDFAIIFRMLASCLPLLKRFDRIYKERISRKNSRTSKNTFHIWKPVAIQNRKC